MDTKENEPYSVVFTREPGQAEPKPGTIVIAPSKPFAAQAGYEIDVAIVARTREGVRPSERISTVGYLGFLGKLSSGGDLSELLAAFEEQGAHTLPSEKLPKFFMMLPDVRTYRVLVAQIGSDETFRLLRSINDMVVAGEIGGGGTWLRPARESRLFVKSFLRQSESYFAWKNAGPILKGEEFEEVGRLSERLRITFQLAARPNAHDLEFSFSLSEPVLPKRFAVVIGKNGVGKSQTLGRIARSALRGSGELTDGGGDRPQINRLLAFYPTATSANVFPQQRRGGRIWYRRFSLSHPGVGRGRHTTSDLIVQLARTEERIAGTDRLAMFLVALRAIDGFEDLAFRARGDLGFVPIHDLMKGERQERLDRYAAVDTRYEPVRLSEDRGFPLSSGELAFVRFATLASLFIENSSLLLFDEPETHLHPNFISQFAILLDSLLKQTGSGAIIATHSAYFVRETFEDQVRILRSGPDREIEVVIPRLKTFGADVGTISYFVFGEDEPSRLAKQVEDSLAGSERPWGSIFAQYKDELSLELLSEIRAEIEDQP